MSHSTEPITGRIDDLVVKLDTLPDGRERLLTVRPITRRASLTLYRAGRQLSTVFGRVHRGYLITDRTLPNGRRWVRIAAVMTLSLWLGGCTGGVSFGWGPDGYRHESQSYRNVYVEHAQR